MSLPAGSYRMGSPADEHGHDITEGLRHGVRIPAFAIGRTEVTVAEYSACVSAGACAEPAWQVQGNPDAESVFLRSLFQKLGDSVSVPGHPVTGVSWPMARQYTDWLSQITGQRYRLPSEDRVGIRRPSRHAHALEFWRRTLRRPKPTPGWRPTAPVPCTPVASRRPNPWGLFDMHGSVWEWTQDCFEHWDYYEHWDPRWDKAPRTEAAWEPEVCRNRVMRGGSWQDGARTPAQRRALLQHPLATTPLTGFRVARRLP